MTTKYKNILFSGLLASVILVTASCNLSEQESFTGASTLSASSPTVTINADDFQNIPGVEKDETYTYTVTLSEPQIADVKIQVFQSGGTATEGEDFDLGEHTLIIKAYETSTTGSITTYVDTEPEDSETLQITIGDETTANASWTPQVYDFTLDNFVSEVLDVSFDFCVNVINEGDEYAWADFGGDPDVYLSEAAGFDINDPWASNVVDGAATGDCPEVMTIDKAILGDGEYILWHEMWANGNSSFWEDQLIPISAAFVRAGAFKQTVVQNDSQAIRAQDPGVADADYEGTNIWGAIALVKIEGDIYTITALPEAVASKMLNGKMTAARVRPAGINKTTNPGLMLNK